MKGEERRQEILKRLSQEETPVSAAVLAAAYGVSRQIIVQDIDLLRAQGAPMGIRSRMDVKRFVEGIAAGKSSLLKNVTSNYHYHTVRADSQELLDLIEKRLEEEGFLAPLQDFEPVECSGCG